MSTYKMLKLRAPTVLGQFLLLPAGLIVWSLVEAYFNPEYLGPYTVFFAYIVALVMMGAGLSAPVAFLSPRWQMFVLAPTVVLLAWLLMPAAILVAQKVMAPAPEIPLLMLVSA
jgi:hypothetical protein